jgi:hypothetical protein
LGVFSKFLQYFFFISIPSDSSRKCLLHAAAALYGHFFSVLPRSIYHLCDRIDDGCCNKERKKELDLLVKGEMKGVSIECSRLARPDDDDQKMAFQERDDDI